MILGSGCPGHAPLGPPRIPLKRRHVLDPPPEYAEMRASSPISSLTYADGHVGWIVTSFDLARLVLQDGRFSSRPELRHSAVHLVLGDGQPPEEDVPGMFVGMDPPDHSRYRRLLTGELSVRRMRELEPRIEEIANQLVAAMVTAADKGDLVASFAVPLPSLVICEMLGIPYTRWQEIRPVSEKMLRTDSTPTEVKDCYSKIFAFLGSVVSDKHKKSTEDLLGVLVALEKLTDVELTAIAFQLFTAGHETTANMLALGMYTLLRHPDQLAALKRDPTMVEGAVEELLRYLTVIQFGISRAALEDVSMHGITVRRGQTVTIALAAANRDPQRFPNPDVLDLRRPAAGNLAFGFGVHQCVAQQLARAELRIGLRTIMERLPDLQLDCPQHEVPMRSDAIVYGVRSLPVRW